jgi:hypothetical protein
MKKYLTVFIILCKLNLCLSQNYWIHSLYGYNADVSSKSFELVGDEIFINTWANPTNGQPSIIKKINSSGDVVSQLLYLETSYWSRFLGIDNRIYSIRSNGNIVKMSNNFDTLNQININNVGFMQLFSSNEIFINSYNNLSMLDSNLMILWEKTLTQSFPSYQSAGITYNPQLGSGSSIKTNDGEIISIRLFEHLDPNYIINPDSSNCVILKINPSNGVTIDSLPLSFNSCKSISDGSDPLCLNANGEVVFSLVKYDIDYNIILKFK